MGKNKKQPSNAGPASEALDDEGTALDDEETALDDEETAPDDEETAPDDEENKLVTSISGFGETAVALAKNPLGIIALFIVLVYGGNVLIVGPGTLGTANQSRIVWFLVGFPILVLASFVFLVTKHHYKLYGPGAFQSDESFLKLQRKIKVVMVGIPQKVKKAEDQFLTRIKKLSNERDKAVATIEKLLLEQLGQRDRAIAIRDEAIAKRDEATATIKKLLLALRERDKAITERDKAIGEVLGVVPGAEDQALAPIKQFIPAHGEISGVGDVSEELSEIAPEVEEDLKNLGEMSGVGDDPDELSGVALEAEEDLKNLGEMSGVGDDPDELSGVALEAEKALKNLGEMSGVGDDPDVLSGVALEAEKALKNLKDARIEEDDRESIVTLREISGTVQKVLDEDSKTPG